MTITGKIYLIKDEQVITDKFKKRDLIIQTTDQYPQFVPIQFTQDKCSVLDKYSVGQDVEVSVNVRGRKSDYQGDEKFFLSLEGWKIGPKDMPY